MLRPLICVDVGVTVSCDTQACAENRLYCRMTTRKKMFRGVTLMMDTKWYCSYIEETGEMFFQCQKAPQMMGGTITERRYNFPNNCARCAFCCAAGVKSGQNLCIGLSRKVEMAEILLSNRLHVMKVFAVGTHAEYRRGERAGGVVRSDSKFCWTSGELLRSLQVGNLI